MKNLENNLADLLDKVEDGAANPLEVYANLKTFEKFVKDCISQVEPLAMDEAGNYNEKTFSEFGYEITKRNGSVTYDYNANAEYKEKYAALSEYKKILTQASKLGKAIVDEDSGEIFQPCPVKSGAKDSLVIKKIN
jgi:hypothetical protein